MNDIIDTAIAAGMFETLVDAVSAAGLTRTLKGDRPMTVFAPSDAAFASLPDGAIEALVADRRKLASILAYHLVEGRMSAAELMYLRGGSIDTVNGADIDITVEDCVVLNGVSNVVQADIECTNGVIHVIDVVLLPA